MYAETNLFTQNWPIIKLKCPIFREAEFWDLKQVEFFLETLSNLKSPEIPKIWVLFLVLPLNSAMTLDKQLYPFRGLCSLTNQKTSLMQLIYVKVLSELQRARWWEDGIANVAVWLLVNIPQFTITQGIWSGFCFLHPFGFCTCSRRLKAILESLMSCGLFLDFFFFLAILSSRKLIPRLKSYCRVRSPPRPWFSLPEMVLTFLAFYFCSPLRPLKFENSFNSPVSSWERSWVLFFLQDLGGDCLLIPGYSLPCIFRVEHTAYFHFPRLSLFFREPVF